MQAVMDGIKECAGCHVAFPVVSFSFNRRNPDGLERRCRRCHSASVRRSQKAHPEVSRAVHRAFNAAHRDRSRASSKSWRERNPEKAALQRRNWSQRNPDKMALKRRRWRRRNPDKVTLQKLRRERLEKSAFREVVNKSEVYARDGGRCLMCKLRLSIKEATLDHIVPLVLGGAHSLINVRLACRPCNSRRGAGRIPAQMRLQA